MSKRSMSALAVIAATLLTTLLPVQQAAATTYEARQAVRISAVVLVNNGYYFNSSATGYLPYHTYGLRRLTLYQGVKYAFVASGCNDAHDVDLVIYDDRGYRLAYDTTRDKAGVVTMTPTYTGTYFAQIVMTDSTPDGAHYALTVGTKSQ